MTLRQAALVQCALVVAGPVRSQDLDSRAYAPALIGTRIALAGLRNSDGAYIVYPAQLIRDANVDIAFALIGAGYASGIFRRS